MARVFVSSTFRDMQAERDHLVTVVFPELRERAQRLGLELFDVDLRWGVPRAGADGEKTNSWEYCKRWIDRVEPFFICILGQRYGWIPNAEEIKDPSDRKRMGGMSITEMEVRHAALSEVPSKRSYFYLRNQQVFRNVPEEIVRTFVDSEKNQTRLEALKSDIERSGRPVRRYSCRWNGTGFDQLDAFGQMVLEDLWSGLLRDPRFVPREAWERALENHRKLEHLYGDDAQPIPREIWERIVTQARPPPRSPLDAETQQMADFADSRLRWFRGREQELNRLTAFVGDLPPEAGRLCVVRGAPGQGKSALLAQFTRRLAGSSHLVIAHFVGASEHSSDVRWLLERLVAELDRAGLSSPGDWREKTDLLNLTKTLAQRLEDYAGERRIVLIIDAVNQLTDGDDLRWLPSNLGPGVRVIVSCAQSGTESDPREKAILRNLADRRPEPCWVDLAGLEHLEVGEIVKSYLAEHCRELDTADLEAIRRTVQARNPLYLLVLLQELRVQGGEDTHLRVSRIISDLAAERPDAISLFEWVLENLERAFGLEETRLWFSCLSSGRNGMSSRELGDLLERALGRDVRAAALRIERGARRYLLIRSGTLGYFHGQFPAAVRRRYLSDQSKCLDVHSLIADYFDSRRLEPCARALEELPFHLQQAGQGARLSSLLTDLPYLQLRTTHCDVHSLVDDFDRLGSDQIQPARPYQDLLRQHAERLARHRGSLFSLVQLEGPAEIRRQADALIQNGTWKSPWFRTLRIDLPRRAEDSEPSDSFEPLASCELRSSPAVALAGEVGLAFAVVRLGEITVVDVKRGRIRPVRIKTRPVRPLSLSCSIDGRYLAIACEDARAEILKLEGEPGTAEMRQHQAGLIDLRLPSSEAPVVAFDDGVLWYQASSGSISRLEVGTGKRATVVEDEALDRELSAVVRAGKTAIVALRERGGTRLVRFAPDGGRTVLSLAGADVTAACPFDRGRIALALSNRKLTIVDVTSGIAPGASLSIASTPVALAALNERLVWICGMGRLHAWKPAPAEAPSDMGSILIGGGSERLAVRADGTLLAVGGNMARHFAVNRASGAAKGRILAVFAEEGPERICAFEFEGSTISLVTSRSRQRVLTRVDLPEWCFFAKDGQGRYLTATYGGRAAFVETQGSIQVRPLQVPGTVRALAGSPQGGFWLLTEVAEVWFLDASGSCRSLHREAQEILGGLSIHAWPDLLLWTATQRHGASTVPSIRFSCPPAEPGSGKSGLGVSLRLFGENDGYLEAVAFDSRSGRLVTFWQGGVRPRHLKWGRTEDYLAGSERVEALHEIGDDLERACFSRNGGGLYLLTRRGALLRFDATAFGVQGALVGSLPFRGAQDDTTPDTTGDPLLLIRGETEIVSCNFEGPKT